MPMVQKLPVANLDINGWHAVRTTLQMLVNKVMADNRLDALVYPTKTIPAPLLASPVEPTNLKTSRKPSPSRSTASNMTATVDRVVELARSADAAPEPERRVPGRRRACRVHARGL